ncbi:uncharacterized protein MONBRDRAFT_9893 [Monosiga brevicollis MX1]|uniref:Uncharacterized protein n=1 Tax=Monosiga brevicollis TaxID=81824 RepID=A9V4J5_MONBE|nr:uncharacterized protein MONBRDRAFT_9893 [Monosiga brevicollis MX1]EDQ87624.1 predicted protein [Monosiga brevicollis MX1]|eukprot:XP_001747544.1 hypothetical protein [Monosiga brevicollis MX1]
MQVHQKSTRIKFQGGCHYRHELSVTLKAHLRLHEKRTSLAPAAVPTVINAHLPSRLKPARTRKKKREVKFDQQHGIVGAQMFMTEIGCLLSPAFESPVCTQCSHVLSGSVPHHLLKKHHVRCSQEDVDAAMALLRPLQPEEPSVDLGPESGPCMPIEGIPILDGVGCPLCQACFTSSGSLRNHVTTEHPDEPEAKYSPRQVKLQKPLRGVGARCVEVIVEESHDASAADVSENEEELEEQQRFKQFISSTQAMASEAEEKRCPHGVHQMHPFYDSVGMTLVINELKPERMVELGHNTPSALLESGMHELFWSAYEQLSDQGLAAAAVTRLFDDNEGQYQHRPMRQVQPQTVSRYLSLGTRLVQFLLLLEAMPAPDPLSFLGQHHVRCSQEDIDAAMALLRPLQPEEPPIDLGAESEPRTPIEGIPILDGVGCPLCQACFTTKGSLWNHIVAEHPDEPEAKQPPRRVKLQKPLRGAGARCVEVIVEESHDASAADVSENEEELEEQQRFKQFISSTQAMASEAEDKRCPHGVHQMHPFYDSVGMTLVINELKPERMVELGHNTPSALLESGMHELFWSAYEQLSDQGLAAAAVTRLFDDNEGQYQHRPMRQVQPRTVSRYLSLGTRLVQFLLLLEAMPAPDPSSFLGQVLASRGPAVINATAALSAGLNAEMTKKELVEPLTSLWLALVEVELSLFDNDKVHFVNVFLLCTAVSKGSGILQDIRQWTTTPAGLLYVFKLFLLRRGKNESWSVANELRPYMQPGRLVHFLSQRMSMARTASMAEGQAGVDVDIRADGDVRDARNHYNNSHLLFNIAPLQAMVSPATIYAAFRRQMTTYLHRPKLGVATWRHAATFWMTTFVINRLSAETTGALGSLIHTQAQHSGDTAQQAYARTASDHVQTKMSSRLMHQVASQKWHALFGLDRRRSMAELTANQEALEARYPISWNPVTDLSPEANGRIIMNTRAEHDVPYMTQLAKQASISWGHSFNSQEQLDLAAAIDQHRPEDGWLIVVAPTGMGKTFCTLPKLGCRPHAGTVLWIVPFVAVANDLLRRFQGAGHSAQRWLGPSTQVADGLDVLIVTTDMFVRVGSESLHGKVCFQRIRTVVMDEAHTLISDASYRDVMDEVAASVGSGGWTNIKRVALTGTLCIGNQEHLFRKLGQQVGGKVYRLETMRRDLQLRVLHGNQLNFLSHVQAIVDTQRVMRQANGERVHMMVFCDTVNEVKLLCDQLHAYGYVALPYYTDLEEKAQKDHVAQWQRGECDVIVTTSCLSTGVDLLTIRHVLWYGNGYNVYTLAQRLRQRSRLFPQQNEQHRVARAPLPLPLLLSLALKPRYLLRLRHRIGTTSPQYFGRNREQKKNYLMNYAAADKFIGVLKLMDDYCMRCTIRQAKPVLKAGHRCVCNRVCERCHFGGHETSDCSVHLAYPDRACCYACGMPSWIRGCKTWDHRCRQSQGLNSGLSCLLLYSDCHPGLRDLAQRMGYNLRERTLKDLKTRDLFVEWLYSPVPGLPPRDGHWRLVEFVFESARVLLPSAAKAQVGPLDSFR